MKRAQGPNRGEEEAIVEEKVGQKTLLIAVRCYPMDLLVPIVFAIAIAIAVSSLMLFAIRTTIAIDDNSLDTVDQPSHAIFDSVDRRSDYTLIERERERFKDVRAVFEVIGDDVDEVRGVHDVFDKCAGGGGFGIEGRPLTA